MAMVRRIFWIASAIAAGSALAIGAALTQSDVLAAAFAASGPEKAGLSQPQAPATQPQPVRAMTVTLVPLVAVTTYTGTIRPRHQGPLAFRVGGKVAERLVDLGDRVAAGQVIARLDETDIRLTLEAAEAEVRAATTDLTRATADETRSRELLERGFVAQAALDRATSGAAEARSRLDRAMRTRDQAQNQLAYTVLKADAEGVVTARTVEAGEVVQAGQPIVTVARTDTVEAEIALPEQRRASLDAARFTATLWGEEDTAHPLALREVSPDVDAVARTYRVRLSFDHPDGRMALGRTVTVALSPNRPEEDVVPLPLAAVLGDGAGAAVWRIAGDTGVERVAVTVVALRDAIALVRGPLAPGDRVVALGAQKIDPARPVRIVELTPPPAP
jgi:RND family efflux transporter MFP subunit